MVLTHHRNNIDMLHGSLFDKILIFALPLAASMMLQQLFNSADVAVVGRFDSPQAMAAVGSNGAAINLMVNLFVGLSIGANVIVARSIGRNDTSGIHDAVHTSITLSLIGGVILVVWGLSAARTLLTLMNTPSDIIELAVVYFRIYFLGAPFIMLYNFGAAILRSKGDSRRPLISLAAGGVINVILNVIFVVGFKMSVAGVAIATVLSNVVSSFMILRWLMLEEAPFTFRPSELMLKRTHAAEILKVGLPAGIQGSLFSISNVCIQTAINGIGSYASAGSAAALNFDFLVYYIVAAFTQAAVTFTSQNFGAGNYRRCDSVFRVTMLAGTGFTGLACLVCWLWCRPLLSVYTTNPEVLHYAEIRMLHVVCFLWMTNFYEISGGCLRGMGHSTLPSVMVLLGCCVLRIVWVYTVFTYYNDFTTLMNVYPLSWLITSIVTLAAYWQIRPKLSM
ncbi:MAG: MATE family efflux transporter [Synergistaceae bacterium]|nr:MATE family efflux transporter [Synergistaceae bacterium]